MSKVRAAVVRETGGGWSIEDLSIRDPDAGEVLVRFAYAGLCYSDIHMEMDASESLPKIAGHEGSGIVEAIGPGVTRVSVGDHVAVSPIPICGVCSFCRSGRVTLCSNAAAIHAGAGIAPRLVDDLGSAIVAHCGLGTIAERGLVSESSVVSVDPALPLEAVALISCGVLTGWGSAIHIAKVQPGQSVAIVGAGGVGANAIQGARIGGATTIVAIESHTERSPLLKRLGATAVVESCEAAHETMPEGFDAVIVCVSDLSEQIIRQSFELTARGGVLVLASLGDDVSLRSIQLSGAELVLSQRTIVGTLMGGSNPLVDIPVIAKHYANGDFLLDELISQRYGLGEIEEGFADLLAGKNVRGLVTLEG